MKKLILEVGISDINQFELSEGIHVDLIENYSNQISLPLEVIKYCGMRSVLSSGRISNNTSDLIIKEIEKSNLNDRGFIVAFNSMRLPDKSLDTLVDEFEVLKVLSEHKKNAVVIGNDKLLNFINNKFPSLKTICSSIQFLDYLNFKDYVVKFEKYDLLVPLSQHTTYDFLKKYKNYSNQMLLFLNYTCNNPELFKCFIHYNNINNIDLNFDKIKGEFHNSNIIPSQLKIKYQNCGSYKLLINAKTE
jgi:hypothetical protein